MKGLVLIYLITGLATVGALRYPLAGLYAFVGFAILRPQSIFGWAGDLSNVSLIVGTATLIGWALQGFGSWRFGRAKSVVTALLLFVGWFTLSSTQALDSSRSFNSLYELSKLVLPVLVGVTMMNAERDRRRMLWVIVLAQGYVGFEMNLNYLRGFNEASSGFGGMDNNCFGASLVTVVGPAVVLAIVSTTWTERILASSAALLILHTVLLTFSRGAMVGLLAVAVTAFVMMPKRPRYMAGLVLVVLITLRLIGPQLADRYLTTFSSVEERDGSAQSRVDLWRDCLLVIQEYPVFGVGPANWRTIAANYGWPEGKSAHSVWMETAAENGIPGVTFLLLFFLTPAVKLWPTARQRLTPENSSDTALAAGAVLAVVGFAVSGQFVSVPALEVPYYVVMVGVAMLKTSKVPARDTAPSVAERRSPLAPAPPNRGPRPTSAPSPARPVRPFGPPLGTKGLR